MDFVVDSESEYSEDEIMIDYLPIIIAHVVIQAV